MSTLQMSLFKRQLLCSAACLTNVIIALMLRLEYEVLSAGCKPVAHFAECRLLCPQPLIALCSSISLLKLTIVSAEAAQTERVYEHHATTVSSRQAELPDQQAPSFIRFANGFCKFQNMFSSSVRAAVHAKLWLAKHASAA